MCKASGSIYILPVVLLALISSVCADIHVNSTGKDAVGCGTPALPCQSLKFAVEVVAAGLVVDPRLPVNISIAEGYYYNASCGITAAMALNITGAHNTVVNCDDIRHTLFFLRSNQSLWMSNIVITKASSVSGGAAVALAWNSTLPMTAVFRGVDVLLCSSEPAPNAPPANGGGISIMGSGMPPGTTVLFERCQVANNDAGACFAAAVGSELKFDVCMCAGLSFNSSGSGGGVYAAFNLDNDAPAGLAFTVDSCNFQGNAACA